MYKISDLPNDVQEHIKTFIDFKRIKQYNLMKRYDKILNKLEYIKKGELFHKAIKNPELFNLQNARETPKYYMFEPKKTAKNWYSNKIKHCKKGNLDYLNELLYKQLCWKWIRRKNKIIDYYLTISLLKGDNMMFKNFYYEQTYRGHFIKLII
jgi:hypothetical protein